MKTEVSPTAKTATQEWVELVRERVDRVRYGEIELVIHDGRVTQVQCTEKMRLP